MKLSNLFIFLLGISILAIEPLSAQRDTLFWFVAPRVTNDHGNTPILFRLSAFDQPATVTIEQPANPNFNTIVVNLPANGAQTIDVTNQIAQIQNQPAAQIRPFGFRIRSTQQIFAYYEVNRANNPDIFSLKGRNALGTSFFVPIQNTYNNGNYNPPARAGFDIVATEDNTQVTIIPAHAAIGHAAGVPFTITLNKGQTYCVEANSVNANAKLSGSRVTSTKPIAITMKDDSAGGPGGGCRDLNGDQLVPVNILGEEYIVVKGFLNNQDHVYVVGTENNTQVSINGANVANINAGQTFMHNLTANAIYLTSDKPVYVLHLSGYGCEVGSAILPTIKCTGSQKVNFVRSTTEDFFLILFTKTGNQGAFTLNGNPGIITAAQFTPVPGTNNEYQYARIQFNTTQVPANVFSTVENSAGVFHLGLINGSPSGGTRYGYFSDFRGINFDFDVVSQITCNGAADGALVLNVSGGSEPYTYNWSNGATGSSINNLSGGLYSVNVIDAEGCDDNFQIELIEPEALNLSIVDIVNASCFGYNDGAIQVNFEGGTTPYSFSWSSGQQTQNISQLTAGVYTISANDANNCGPVTLDVTVAQPTQIIIQNDSILNVSCNGLSNGGIFNTVSGGVPGYTFIWNGNNSPTEDLIGVGAGDYSLIVTDATNCTSSQQFTITQPSQLQATVSQVIDVNCFGQNTGAITTDVQGGSQPYSFVWSSGQQTQNLNNIGAGNYTFLVIDAQGCIDSLSVSVSQRPEFTLTLDSVFNASCFGFSDGAIFTTISGGTTPYSINWSNGSNSPDITGLPQGIYTLTVNDNFNCAEQTLEVEITQPDSIILSIENDVNPLCEGDQTVLQASGAVSYQWSPANSLSASTGEQVVASPTVTTTYQLTGTAANGCTASINYTLNVFPYIPTVIGLQTEDLCFLKYEFTALVNPSSNINSWSWTFENNEVNSTNPVSTVHTFSQSGFYTVSIETTDPNGCTNVYEELISVEGTIDLNDMLVPNIITPNGDGINDEFLLNSEVMRCYNIGVSIYNRWGTRVFFIDHINNKPFAGEDNRGNKLSPGVYFYILKGDNGWESNGTITIVY